MKAKGKARHRLDDPLTDRTLLCLFLIAQGWSTWGMYGLARWANFDWITAAVPAILIDGVAFIAARSASSNLLPNEKGWRVRRLAAWIAAACFLLALTGNIAHSHVTAEPGAPQLQTWLHDALAGVPVALLIGTLVLRTRRGAWREHVVARELREQIEAEQRAAAERAAQQRRLEVQEAAEQARAAEEAERERERAAVEAERARQREHELQLARQQAAAAQPAPVRPAPGRPKAIEPAVAASTRDEARYAALDGSTKSEKARAWILEEWAAGRTPNGDQVDEVVGGSSTGRKALAALKADGYVPGENPFPLRSVAR